MTAISDDGGPANPRHPRDRAPPHPPPLPTRLTQPGDQSGEPLAQFGDGPGAQHRQDHPVEDVEESDERWQVAPRQPDPVARLEAVDLGGPGRLARVVPYDDVPRVTDRPARVPAAPGELHALVGVEVLRAPPATVDVRLPAYEQDALPQRVEIAGPGGVADAQPW